MERMFGSSWMSGVPKVMLGLAAWVVGGVAWAADCVDGTPEQNPSTACAASGGTISCDATAAGDNVGATVYAIYNSVNAEYEVFGTMGDSAGSALCYIIAETGITAVTLSGGSWNDTLGFSYLDSGSTQWDLAAHPSASSFVGTISGLSGDDDIEGSDDAVNTYSETLSGGSGIDEINGNLGADLIQGGAGDDELDGGGGNDTIHGDGGEDTIYGGDQDDTIYGGPDDDTIDGEGDQDTIYGNAGDDLIYGSDSNDTLNGNDGDDYLSGGNQGDTLRGGEGNDDLIGGAGDDDLFGDLGDDVLCGGDDGPNGDDLQGGSGADKLWGMTASKIVGTANTGKGGAGVDDCDVDSSPGYTECNGSELHTPPSLNNATGACP